MFKLNNDCLKELLKYTFRDGAYWEDKYYKYINVQYIYDFLKEKTKEYNIWLEDYQHSHVGANPFSNKVIFTWHAMDSRKEKEYDVVIVFVNGEADKIKLRNTFYGNRIIKI